MICDECGTKEALDAMGLTEGSSVRKSILACVGRGSTPQERVTVDDEEQQDELNRTVRLSHWTGDRKAGWEIRTDTNPDIYSLRHMNKFDLLLAKLQRADARIIIDETADEDFVYSDTKPEPTYE